MQKMTPDKGSILVLFVAGLLLSAPAIADSPSGMGSDNRGKQDHAEKHERHDDDGHYQRGRDGNVSVTIHFDDHQRTIVHDYYGQELRRGHCPPGLAKKHNGCMPPGQAKKWRMGRPLPRDVIFYDLPPRVIIELGSPPPRHRYVRVAADILLITIGTGLVVDAIEDLSNM